MNLLFPIEPNYPPGFSYTPDFITAEEETQLLKAIQDIQLHNFNFQGYTANRKIASFGYDYSFDNRTLSKGKPIPSSFNFLIERISEKLAIQAQQFAELLVTEYPIGSVINWHRDAPPFDIIAGLSLAGNCTFRLRPQEKNKQTRSAIISFPVSQRSLYLIKEEARTEWQHSTAPVKQVRYSITLRTLRF
ncbi:MAG: alpha-ketoglutarate-dependent dioxygenase AlkB [Segetibacter sp.]|nr:alpha-ketoglutarate-dependent dioxygenase AlkB [Segetibacter sp.]